MAAGEEEQNKGEGRGFAGLSSLVSDVDMTLPPLDNQETTDAGASSNAKRPAATQSGEPEPQPPRQQPHQAPSQPSPGSSTGGWVLGIAAVIGVFWLIGQSDKNSPTSPPSDYTQSAQTQDQPLRGSNPLDEFDPSTARLVEPQVSSRPEEARPPVGQDLVFSTAQIRYCLAEDIRMDGAKAAVNNYSDSDVDQFNAMAADYNSRCGSFRYRSGALESARGDIEPYRDELQAEGARRFARSPPTDSPSTPTPSRPAPDATVQAIQQRLNEAGYKAGPADGLMRDGTRLAIIAFQQDRGLIRDGSASVALLRQLERIALDERVASAAAQLPETPNRDNHEFPRNATPNYFGDGWECDRGYYKAGNECRTVQIPQNASLNYLGDGWECNQGYYKTGNECRTVQIPQNASLNSPGNGWECNRGYYRAGNECRTVQIPQNASLNFLGDGWECNQGYYKTGNECRTVQIP